MRVDRIRRLPFPLPRIGAWCVVRPDWQEPCEQSGLATAGDFLALPGVVVSGHVGRNVSRVRVGGASAFLKREHRVRLRDRFRSWTDGFGWSSMSAREAAVLRHLAAHDLPGPRWLAYGEAEGQGFLLVEAAPGTELRQRRSLTEKTAGLLGQLIARLHAAGIDQPDLFAKHFLLDDTSGRWTVLDWQRTVIRPHVSWRQRIRGLAALRATLPAATDREWEILLAAYRHAAAEPSVPADLLARVARTADSLAQRSGIRSQRNMHAGAVNQELIRIGGETVCATPSLATELDDSDVIASLYDPARDNESITFPDGCEGLLRVRHYGWPLGRWLAALRGKSWRSPELRGARLLFHLERYGIRAPRLLAYGQQVYGPRSAAAFLLQQPVATRPIGPEDRGAIETLLRRLHESGVSLGKQLPRGLPLGMIEADAVVTDVMALRLVKKVTSRTARMDFTRLDDFFRSLT